MKLQVLGRELYAYTGGRSFDPALPCVVFIHGALHDHSVWTLLARWFAHHGHAVLALDLPGHGRSEGPAPASIEAAANGVLALLDAAGVRSAALVGHSMGALIALEASARAGERFTGLVLAGMAYPMKVSAALLELAREQPLKAIDQVNAWSISTTAAKPSHPGPGTWLHGANRAQMRHTLYSQGASQDAAALAGSNLFEHDFQICNRYANGLQAAAAVRCPATLVLGASDRMTPPKFAAEIGMALRARSVTLAAGHHLMAEQPDAMLAALRSALAPAAA